MRLDKFLSEARVASRRKLKAIIREGRVTVDGVTAAAPDMGIEAGRQCVRLDGAEIFLPGCVVGVLHKPAGYVTSTADPRDRTVMELLPPELQRLGLKPVGRLDRETEGLLLFTNDGGLNHRLTAPGHRVEKEYYAETDGEVDASDVEAFADGLRLRDGTLCLPAQLLPCPGGCRVVVREGKYHQIRRMLAARGKPVVYLRREREGRLELGSLGKGEFRLLTPEEAHKLL